MDVIARPSNGINLSSEECYHIMTKKAVHVDSYINISKTERD